MEGVVVMDFCPRCRIQAPHDARRTGCPRCGGPLMVVDDPSRIPPRPAPPQPAPPGPASAPAPRRADRRIRWVARRPPEALPPPRAREAVSVSTATPRYDVIPRWGLFDVATVETPPVVGRMARWAQTLEPLLATLTTLLVLTAGAQAWIYALLVVNRDEPLDGTLVGWSDAITWALGVISVVTLLGCFVAFVAWLRHRRELAYAGVDRVDPRPHWHLWVGCLVPVLNLVAPAVFVHELASCGHQLPADRFERTLRLWWTGWVVLNVLAAITLGIRFGSDSIQWGANAVLLTVICDLAGAAFTFATARLLRRTFDPDARTEPTTRWLAV